MTTAGKTDTGPATQASDDDWVSLGDAARMLGESRQGVLTRAVKGEVIAKHIAGRTVVTRQSVERVLAAKEQGA
jgi:hypothetical protein